MKDRYELFRKVLIILKHSLSKDLSLFWSFIFAINYLFLSFLSKKKRLVAFRSRKYPVLYLRSSSSDIEVLVQHLIHRELDHKSLTSLSRVEFILDAGANIGITTVVLSLMFPEAKILAIELDPRNTPVLQKNCKGLIKSGRVEIIEGAFYPDENKNLFIVQTNDEFWGTRVSESGDGDRVDIITPESISEKWGKHPDLIKMDIEGAEKDFISARDSFQRILSNSHLLIEIHRPNTYIEFFHLLKDCGYDQVDRVGEFWFTKAQKNGSKG